MPELPDWLRAFALLGKHGVDYVVVAVDEDGQLYALVRGVDGAGDLHTLAVDDEGQLIMVPRGSTGNYLAVDNDGYLTAVFKGDYAGALRTVTLDDEGRISAFIYDSEDAWGRTASVGFAELAVRLGSPIVYERSGEVHFVETFGYGLQRWAIVLDGTGAKAQIDPTSYYSDGYSLVMQAGSDGSQYARVTMKRSLLPVGKIGLGWMWAIAGNLDWIDVYLKAGSLTKSWESGFRWTSGAEDAELRQSGPAWVKLDDMPIPERTKRAWNSVKFVVDLDNDTYDTAKVNAENYDVTSRSLITSAGASDPYIEIRIDVVGGWSANREVFLDNIVLTLKEP